MIHEHVTHWKLQIFMYLTCIQKRSQILQTKSSIFACFLHFFSSDNVYTIYIFAMMSNLIKNWWRVYLRVDTLRHKLQVLVFIICYNFGNRGRSRYNMVIVSLILMPNIVFTNAKVSWSLIQIIWLLVHIVNLYEVYKRLPHTYFDTKKNQIQYCNRNRGFSHVTYKCINIES